MRLILDRDVRLFHGGRTLVARGRIIRLTESGPAALRALLADTATPAQRRLGERLIDAGFAHPRPAPRAIDATVVIPVKDDPHALAQCLATIRGDATLPPPAAAPPPPAAASPPPAAAPPPPAAVERHDAVTRVIVVDDGSTDAAAIAAAAGAATLVRRDQCGGPAAARNTGVAHVDTPFVAFLDADTRPPADWIERLGGHFDDPRVAAVAPRIAERLLDMGPRRNVAYVPSAALIVRTELAHFDEQLRYGEDVDLVWRLRDAGWRVVYEPDVIVGHDQHHTFTRRFRYGTSAEPLRRRHPTRLRHVSFPRTRTRAVARELAARGLPRRLALAWTARVWLETARGTAKLASPYGIGVLWGRIRGLPTISGPSIP